MWTQMRTTPPRNGARERDVAVQALEGVDGLLLEVGVGGGRGGEVRTGREEGGSTRGLVSEDRALGLALGAVVGGLGVVLRAAVGGVGIRRRGRVVHHWGTVGGRVGGEATARAIDVLLARLAERRAALLLDGPVLGHGGDKRAASGRVPMADKRGCDPRAREVPAGPGASPTPPQDLRPSPAGRERLRTLGFSEGEVSEGRCS